MREGGSLTETPRAVVRALACSVRVFFVSMVRTERLHTTRSASLHPAPARRGLPAPPARPRLRSSDSDPNTSSN
eukprot:360197-Chlamydomonas_euryale.AAC.4